MPGVSLVLSNVILVLVYLAVKQLNYFVLTGLMFVLLLLVDKIKMIWLEINGKIQQISLVLFLLWHILLKGFGIGPYLRQILIPIFFLLVEKLIILTNPYYEFFVEKPNYCFLFPFCSIGAFWHVSNRNVHHNKFDTQCLLGFTLDCSKFTNGVFLQSNAW